MYIVHDLKSVDIHIKKIIKSKAEIDFIKLF